MARHSVKAFSALVTSWLDVYTVQWYSPQRRSMASSRSSCQGYINSWGKCRLRHPQDTFARRLLNDA